MSKNYYDLIIDPKQLKQKDKNTLGELSAIPAADTYTGIPEIRALWERIEQPNPLTQEERRKFALNLYKFYNTIIWHDQSLLSDTPFKEDNEQDLSKIKAKLEVNINNKRKNEINTEIPALIVALIDDQDVRPILKSMKELVRAQFLKDLPRKPIIIKDGKKEYKIFGKDMSVIITEGKKVSFTRLVKETDNPSNGPITVALCDHLINSVPGLKEIGEKMLKEELHQDIFNSEDNVPHPLTIEGRVFNIESNIILKSSDKNDQIGLLAAFLKSKFNLPDQDINCMIDIIHQGSIECYPTMIVPSKYYRSVQNEDGIINQNIGRGDIIVNVNKNHIGSITYTKKYITMDYEGKIKSEIAKLDVDVKFTKPVEQRKKDCGYYLPPFVNDLDCTLKYKALTNEGKLNSAESAKKLQSSLSTIVPYLKYAGVGAAGVTTAACIGLPAVGAAAAGVALYTGGKWIYDRNFDKKGVKKETNSVELNQANAPSKNSPSSKEDLESGWVHLVSQASSKSEPSLKK